MVLNEKNKEKINDLKQLMDLPDNEYEKIIKIFKKYAFNIEEAESYIIRYISYFIKGIENNNALTIFKKKLDVYSYYLSLNEEIEYDTLTQVKKFVNKMKKIDDNQVISSLTRLGYKSKISKIKFLLLVRNSIIDNQIIKEDEKKLLLDRVFNIQNQLYESYLNNDKKVYLKNIYNSSANYYEFVKELLNCNKSEWTMKITEFLEEQNDDLHAKNKLLKIFLMTKLGSSTIELVNLYKLMDGYINPVVEYVKDPLSNELISKETYRRSYSKLNLFFERLKTYSLEEKEEIISLYDELAKDRYYHTLDEVKERVSKMFVALNPNIPNAKEYIDERTNIYISYRKTLTKERMDNLKESNHLWREKVKKENLQEDLEKVKEFFYKYINGKYNIIEEFKKDFNIKGVELRDSLNFIKINDPEFYNIIMKKQNDGMKVINEKIKSLSYYLRNGINNRAFDVIDFYLIYKMDIEVLRNVVQNMTLDNKYTLLRFLSSNIRLERLNAKVILNTLVEVNCEMDENGDLIKGTGFVIPRKIRENAIKFLEKNKIPLNDITYRTLINRYLMKKNIDHQYKSINKR